MKICKICETEKDLSQFTWVNSLGPRKDGSQRETSICNYCRAEQKLNSYRTPEGKLRYIYKHQIKSSAYRNHSAPEYTEKEFVSKFIKDKKYLSLYTDWVASEYDTFLGPSLDRKDDTKGYSFDNIQLMTWLENNQKEHKAHKEGTSLNIDLKPVWQYSIEGEFIGYYISQNEAARNVEGVTQQTISKCCIGEIQRAGRYRWFFEEQFNLLPIVAPEDYSLIYEYCPITKSLIQVYTDIYDIVDSVHEQTSIRRAIRANKLHKERLFSNKKLGAEEIQSFIHNMKGINPIIVYDKELNFINEFRSCNAAKSILGIADTTIKKYALSKALLDNKYYIRLKFDDEIALSRHRHQLINCKFL